MDANGTKFHLLLGKADWERCTDEDGRGLGDPLSPPLVRATVEGTLHLRPPV